MATVAASQAHAQRASENAVASAEDAFGTSVGHETIGLYEPDNVRGFSAIDAGNARLDGIYFDPVWNPSQRLQSATTIRVGIAAQGFLFPAPTGVIDYTLRRPGETAKASGFLAADSDGNLSGELDGELPLDGRTLSLGVGAAGYRQVNGDGTTDVLQTETLILRWRPSDRLELLGFFSHADLIDGQASPIYTTAGEYLPPRLPRRHYFGPPWALNRAALYNSGGLARWQIGDGWSMQGGLFRSEEHDPVGVTDLYDGLTPDGVADQSIIIDPSAAHVSTSGEVRLARRFDAGARQHIFTLSLRGRLRDRSYGGSDVIDLGPIAIDTRQLAPRPPIVFSRQDQDRIVQGTVGLAYELRWSGVGELNTSVQKTDYAKHVVLAGASAGTTHAAPLLYSAAAAAHLTGRLTAYASTTTGLEDSGSAPDSATNRDQPLPAIRTSQEDAGLRLTLTGDAGKGAGGLRLVAGVFQVQKPYFELNAADRYVLLGSIRNRGVELSLSGAATPRLNIVAGAVLSDPTVVGPAVKLHIVGRDPVDQPRRRLVFNADWRPMALPNVTLEVAATAVGRRAATTDDRVHVPARTLVDLGVRYALKLGARSGDAHDGQLRLSVTNVGDVYGVDLYGAGSYATIPGRVVELSLGVDW